MFRFFAMTVTLLWLAVPPAAAQGKYKTYQEAANAGAKFVRAGQLADAREPLEAAVELATTDREKLDARRALMVPYRELQEVAPMQSAAEYIIAHADLAAEQSLTRSTLLNFLNIRGKMADATTGYEERFKKTDDDRTALFLLTEIYGRYKNDPAKSAEFGEKLIALEEKRKLKPYVIGYAEIARQMVLAKRYKDGAELFEKLAPLDKTTEAWNYKEAAVAWQKANDKPKALALAKKSVDATPEKRNEQLTYFWRRALGDLYLALGEPASAVPQYEDALKNTKIDGYLKDTRAKLAEAKAGGK